MARPLLVLVASPLLGPSSWSPLAEELSRRGWEALVTVDEPDREGRPLWQSTVGGVEVSLRDVPGQRAVALIGHSGAGALLPAAAAAIPHHVAGLVFIDAGLPAPGRSRLESMADEGPGGAAFATELASMLDAGRRYPQWTDDELGPLVPDVARRRQLLADLRPRDRAFWHEPLPNAEVLARVPSAYLQFSEAYETAAERARDLGWPVRTVSAGHFHHLVDERSVAATILLLLREIDPSLLNPQ